MEFVWYSCKVMFCYLVSSRDECMHPLQNNEIYLVFGTDEFDSYGEFPSNLFIWNFASTHKMHKMKIVTVHESCTVFWKGNYVMPCSLVKCDQCFINDSEERLRKEKLHNSYFLQNIIGVIKLLKMKSARHVARMGRKYIQSLDRKIYRKETSMNI